MNPLPPGESNPPQPLPPLRKPDSDLPRTSGKAIASMILGFVSFVTCALTSIPAIIFGWIGLSEIKRSNGQLTGTGIAATGIVTGAMGVAMVMMFVPILLLLPAINAAREAARRNGCMNNMRQLATGVTIHENTLNVYPVASTGTADLLRAQQAGGHGDMPAAGDDGFSWLYAMLPYIEEKILSKQMRDAVNSDASSTGPFDADFINSAAGQHFASVQIAAFRCPTFSGDVTTNLGEVEAAVANYCAIVGTDTSEPSAAPWKTTQNWEDGALPSACWNTANSQTAALAVRSCTAKGVSMRDLGDGISKTIIACESREPVYSAWISGASMWVVAASPNSLAASGMSIGQANDGYVSIAGAANGEGLALNFGTEESYAPGGEKYFQASDWATGADRQWGASSEHSGNIVMHVWADVHAKAIHAEVDPTVYLRFITRSAGDPATETGL